jgi:hypothetical protein
MRRWILGLAVVLIVEVQQTQANIILNGDFENNSAAGTMFNMSNAVFNATIANASAFGTAQEIDLITGTSFGLAPQSGNWKLGIHTQINPANFDALSLALAGPLTPGTSYDLSFWAAESPVVGEPGPVEVGVSTSATAFGTLVFSGQPGQTWTNFTQTFIAPSNASYLTVRNALTPTIYNSVDNFSLVASQQVIPEPSTVAIWSLLGGLGIIGWWRRRR